MKENLDSEGGGIAPEAPKGILLVDDDDRVLKFVSRMLHSFGNEQVHLASSGKEALRIWESRRSRIWLVVSDFVMPGMTGDTMAIHMIQQQPQLRVLFISGNDPSSLNSKIELVHGRNFLQKPFSITDLRTVIQNLEESPAPPVAPSLLQSKERGSGLPVTPPPG